MNDKTYSFSLSKNIFTPEGAFNSLIQFKAWQDANVIGLDGL